MHRILLLFIQVIYYYNYYYYTCAHGAEEETTATERLPVRVHPSYIPIIIGPGSAILQRTLATTVYITRLFPLYAYRIVFVFQTHTLLLHCTHEKDLQVALQSSTPGRQV